MLLLTMRKITYLLLASILTILMVSCNSNKPVKNDLVLWYKNPAKKWTQALPIGNGRLGAMIFGGIRKDRIQFNDETFWTGGPRDYNKKDAVKYLPEIRKLIFEGKQKKAKEVAQKHFMGTKSHEADYDSLISRWLKKVRAPNKLKPVKPDYNDSNWHEMKIPTPNGFERVVKNLEGENGAFWFRTTFNLPKKWVGKKMILALGNVRDLDYTYVNGHFLGSEKGKTKIRNYVIPASKLHKGKNILVVQDINFTNKGGLSGFHFNSHEKVRMSVYPKGGSWKNGISLQKKWRFKVENDFPPPAPHYDASYMPFADLWLTFPNTKNVTNYRRSLDLNNALCYTRYEQNGVTYKREYFASRPAHSIVIHLSANEKDKINFDAKLTSKHDLSIVRRINKNTSAIDIRLKRGVLKGESRLRVIVKNGEVSNHSGLISVKNADSATLYLVAGTSFINYKNVSGDPVNVCLKSLKKIQDKSYREIKRDHIRDYQKYFNSFSLQLGNTNNENLPTDARLKMFDKTHDPSLVALYLQFARYLLISSSRPGTFPPNLQGIWNDKMRPPWGSKYTTNINLEMNYWPVEVLNLSSLHMPLFTMMKKLVQTGHETAHDYYGCPGWVLHHNTDIWGGTAPVDHADVGIWPTGGAWLCHQLWEHFQFTQDTTFLKKTAYPMMISAARFFSCDLVKDPDTGWLVTVPSVSPEHGGLVAGPTMDEQIVRNLFGNCIKASEILNKNAALRDTLEQKIKQLVPNQIGKYGQLKEWQHTEINPLHDYHRHVSQLWGVYPGLDITWKTPKLMKAAMQSLIYRGDGGPGWSLAWKINLWDRFKKGNHAYKLVKNLLSYSNHHNPGTYADLLNAGPPFQIDGNFGGAAGIAGMLIQSLNRKIELLPALPKALENGSVKGVKALGDFKLNFKWNNGKLKFVRVISDAGLECHLVYGKKTIRFKTKRGKTYELNGNLKLLKTF